MSETLIKATNIKKHYEIGKRTLPILRGIDIEIRESEILGIVGSSGAGKSTLLHVLGLIDAPSEGELLIQGRSIQEMSGKEKSRLRNRSIGFVFQFYHLIPELSALQNVLLPQMIGTSMWNWFSIAAAQKQRATELLTRFGLGERLTHKPTELSGGEKQRVAIARALLPNPQVMLCDEPTGNLDSKTGTEILDILVAVQRETKMSLVLVTHDEKVAARCQRVIRLADGKLANS